MDEVQRPDVTVVVASFSGEADLARCLDSLEPQAQGAEVIATTTAPAAPVESLRGRFPAVRFVRAPESTSVFALRSLGVARARGRLVALTEGHCTVAPDWLEALRGAHRAGHTVVGGPVENGLVERTYDWALYFCEYGIFMPPLADGPAPALSGITVAYD